MINYELPLRSLELFKISHFSYNVFKSRVNYAKHVKNTYVYCETEVLVQSQWFFIQVHKTLSQKFFTELIKSSYIFCSMHTQRLKLWKRFNQNQTQSATPKNNLSSPSENKTKTWHKVHKTSSQNNLGFFGE